MFFVLSLEAKELKKKNVDRTLKRTAQGRKIDDFCLKQGQSFRDRAAPPTQGYIEYPLPPGSVAIKDRTSTRESASRKRDSPFPIGLVSFTFQKAAKLLDS